MEDKEAFYAQCAELLGIEHVYQTPVRRTRWNKRRLGNGRFPGFGLVRHHGSFIAVISKAGTKQFKSEAECFEYLKNIRA